MIGDNHDPACDGWHTADITCAEVARLRAEHLANPWICRGATRSGYHYFADGHANDDAVCTYKGCDRTWGELRATLEPATPKPTRPTN